MTWLQCHCCLYCTNALSPRQAGTKHGTIEKAQSKNAGKVTYYGKGLLTCGLEELGSGDFMIWKVKFLVDLSL